ncbi:MAG: hypothetical protein FJY75_11060 [Candidatus Eisenbacteria bacterium]|uniref:Uncharacterized protein n=1 Tax=Eiseniibacteriota bacterium TaxID=2212470 RepID=A0A938BPI8_UNCEI|nr:hypothetical protein [Candidatus Eisenbacteria bacterium]
MAVERIRTGLLLIVLGALGEVHEFVLSPKAEFVPVLLFALVVARGATILFTRSGR